MADLNNLQTGIMVFVKGWVTNQKTPIPQKEIIKNMQNCGVKSYTTLNAINSLLTKGYIRRAYSSKQNQSFYCMIRNIYTDGKETWRLTI